MDVQEAYNNWAPQYDTNNNKTRDLEAKALRQILAPLSFAHCLEIGCGTGKNTEWLLTKAQHITAIDFSAEMLTQAKEKIQNERVVFQQTDVLEDWHFASPTYDMAVCSLVLEHIEDVAAITKKIAAVVQPGGYVYIGEFHPFKQYSGSQARYTTEAGEEKLVTAHVHHVSDFVQPALQYGFSIVQLQEYFDEDDRSSLPRILCLLLQKG